MIINAKLAKPMQEFQRLNFEFMKAHGLNTAQSCIVAYLSTQTKEVTLEDVAKHTGYSLATISTTVLFLENIRVLKRNKRPGSKKIYLESNKSPVDIMAKKIKKLMNSDLLEQKDELTNLIKEMKKLIKKEKNKEKKEHYKTQLQLLEMYHKESNIMKEIATIIEKELQKRGRYY